MDILHVKLIAVIVGGILCGLRMKYTKGESGIGWFLFVLMFIF